MLKRKKRTIRPQTPPPHQFHIVVYGHDFFVAERCLIHISYTLLSAHHWAVVEFIAIRLLAVIAIGRLRYLPTTLPDGSEVTLIRMFLTALVGALNMVNQSEQRGKTANRPRPGGLR
jgi:hypothetical protein